MEPNIGISEKNRKKVAELLNVMLADEYVLYVQTLNYHWNVHGHHFHSFHALFEEQYTMLANFIDAIAERARQLGGRALGTLQEFNTYTRLKEQPGEVPDSNQMIANLLAQHEIIIQNLRKEADLCMDTYGDSATNNFLIDLLGKHEKVAWMLRASLNHH